MTAPIAPCVKCGRTLLAEDTPCPDCGHFELGTLVLRGSDGALEFSVGCEVGRPLLPKAVGDDAKFAETVQFILRPDKALGWMLEPCSARNPTRQNDVELAAGCLVRLQSADIITIGKDKARLIVKIIRGGS